MRALLKRLFCDSNDDQRSASETDFAAANAQFAAGRYEEARTACELILKKFPQHANALWLLGMICSEKQEMERASGYIGRAIEIAPKVAKYRLSLGYVRQEEGEFDRAAECYRAAIELDSHYAEAWNNLGCVMQMQGKLSQAADCFRQALEINPNLAQANQNLGELIHDPHSLEIAAKGFRQAIEAHPGDANLYIGLGNTLRDLGKFSEAFEAFDAAIALKPDYAEAHFSKSLALLLQGDLVAGWKEHEWRWQREAERREFQAPQWDGQPMPKGTLFLHAEQGLGDTMQFVRYAPLAARLCGRLVVECQPPLKTLIENMPGIAQTYSQGEFLPEFDAHLPMLSLPYVFNTSLETIPAEIPYLHADMSKFADWRVRLAADGDAFRVGLCWAGRPEHWDDANRSAALDVFAPQGEVRGIVFYSLQKGPAAKQVAHPPVGMCLKDMTAELHDFSMTAALVANLDLVISVDTSIAHLSGALGVPIWTMLPRVPDWRWLLHREDSPWYPGMRLFRQEDLSGWHPVVLRMTGELGKLMACRSVAKRCKAAG
ncbi:MAG: TPR repeat-containing protein YrrB [Betaproteobacteria bacterium ADurb.Bin341]|nr:MAG: TPR repeat-containing protein YrrB [Betaproteobacteria bacterium ADurb.Bin341]